MSKKDYKLNRRDFLKNTTVLMGGTVISSRIAWGQKGANADSPPPGTWQFSPKTLISGQKTHLELRYEHGQIPMPAGSSHGILLEPLSVKSLHFCPPSTDIKVVPYKGKLPKIDLELKPVEGVGFREIVMIFPDGLEHADSFALVIGNYDSNNSIIALVNPVPVNNLVCEVYTDLKGNEREIPFDPREDSLPWSRKAYQDANWFKMGWTNSLPRVDIKPAESSALRLFCPSLVKAGNPFNLRIAVTDAFDSRACPFYEGDVVIEDDSKINHLPNKITFTESDACSKLIENITIDSPGVYRVKAKLEGDSKIFESNPIVVRQEVEQPVYWGSIHNHGQYSECWGDDLDTFYRFAREISGFDFVSLSDHRAQLPTAGRSCSRLLSFRWGKLADSLEEWNNTINKANQYNKLNDFVTLIGYEWSAADPFHYNIYFDDASIDNMEQIFTRKYTDYAFVMRQLLRKTDALFIPHTHADAFPYAMLKEIPNNDGQPLTPVIEIYSDWGCSFKPYGKNDPESRFGALRVSHAYSYLWAVDNGYKLGLIGDSDSHTGLPGRRVTAGVSPVHKHPQGLTAIRTTDFTRKGVMDSYRYRRTYGTTGERIFLEVLAEGSGIGETLRTDKPFNIQVFVAGTDVIDTITLFNGLEILGKKSLDGSREGSVTFECSEPINKERPYLVEVIQKDGNRAWSTPIWVIKQSMPELSWEQDSDGSLYLVNKGTAEARDIEIMYSKTEHPFVTAEIAGKECGHDDTAGFLWTDSRNNQNIILQYRWHGEPLEGKVVIIGVKKYSVELNRIFRNKNGIFKDDGKGNISFRTAEPNNKAHSQGFAIITEVCSDKPCNISFNFEKKVTTLLGDKVVTGQNFTIPLNGRTTNKPFGTKKLDSIMPGQRWKMSAEKGCYAVDPQNLIAETNEKNNLYHL